MITDFCGRFESDFPLAFRWSGLKPIGYSVVESFDEGVGFSWRAYRNLGTGYTCADSVMGSFVDTVGTTAPLVSFDETGITYLAATNARWLPYLADEGIRFVHYPANRVRRQFGLDQDIPDDLSSLMRAPTSVHPFLRHTAFDFWKKRFDAVTVPGSLREGVCTFPMHGYWHAVMDSFAAELAGSRGFSLIPPEGLSTVASVNPRLLLPSRSVLAYARKQSRSAIFEWDAEKKGWFWYAGYYPPGWEKKVKVINLLILSKKAPAKPKSAVKPKFAGKTKPATPLPPAGALPAVRTRGSKRKTTPHSVSATERRVSHFSSFYFFLIRFLNYLAANSPTFSIFFLSVQVQGRFISYSPHFS